MSGPTPEGDPRRQLRLQRKEALRDRPFMVRLECRDHANPRVRVGGQQQRAATETAPAASMSVQFASVGVGVVVNCHFPYVLSIAVIAIPRSAPRVGVAERGSPGPAGEHVRDENSRRHVGGGPLTDPRDVVRVAGVVEYRRRVIGGGPLLHPAHRIVLETP